MSQNANGTVRCDGCGRLSNDRIGEYTLPGNASGYINSRGRNWVFDYCESCAPTMELDEAVAMVAKERGPAVLADALARWLVAYADAVGSDQSAIVIGDWEVGIRRR